MFTKMNQALNFGVYKGTENAGEFEKHFETQGTEIDPFLRKTKTALTERRVRSLKNIL